MSEISLENPFIVTTNYTKFIISNIEIKFNQPAKVLVQLLQDEPASIGLYKTIEIPVEAYENWSYNQEQIITYIKNYLQQ